jgi:hypothetical protein
MQIFLRSIVPAALLSFALLAHAAEVVTLNNPAPGAGATMEDFIYLLINIMQMVAVPALTVCVIYAGYLMATAAGNEEQITKSKMWFLWTLVGGAIVLGAEVIADIVYGTAELF